MKMQFICTAVVVLMTGCGNQFGGIPGDLGQPSANDLDGMWVVSASSRQSVLNFCVNIEDGRPVAFFDGTPGVAGCTFTDSLVTSKPIRFDSIGPVIEFTMISSGLVFDLTIFATQRTDDFFDALISVEGAVSTSVEGQMERL